MAETHAPTPFTLSETILKNKDNLVGFGKHAELTYEQLAKTEKGYVRWFFSQSDMHSRYPDLYEYLEAVGLHSKENTSTVYFSDHNHFQAHFADRQNLLLLVKCIFGDDKNRVYTILKVIFEPLCDADILVQLEYYSSSWYPLSRERVTLLIEIKPTLSNEYPEVLRQMRRQRRSFDYFYGAEKGETIKQSLVMGSYSGDVSFTDVLRIFDDITVVSVEKSGEMIKKSEISDQI